MGEPGSSSSGGHGLDLVPGHAIVWEGLVMFLIKKYWVGVALVRCV